MTGSAADALVKDTGPQMDLARRIRMRKRLGAKLPDAGKLENAILSHEVAIISMWRYAFDTSAESRATKARFHALCSDCLDLLKALPEPEDRTEWIQHRLKIISYAYLGERWEEAQEISDGEIARAGGDSWRDRVFASIFSAVLLLTRKKRLGDLEQASEKISRLRNEQGAMERPYLEGVDAEYRRGAAYELASLYHLAKCVETAVDYMRRGSPANIPVVLDMHFDRAISYCARSGQRDLELVERMLHLVLKKMAENSVWSVASRMAHVKKFVDASLKSDRPVFELLYPQRTAVLDHGLLDPVSRAVVVAMPTSSGKTLMAELRIIQTVKQDPTSWVAYVAPTRALVNQIAARLRRSLRDLGIRVEKMSGAMDLDAFEQSMTRPDGRFNVLVVTPEKLGMLIRRDSNLSGSLALAVIDEAHNLADQDRGLNLEMLLATIKSDCNAGLLLLTPFLPNGEQVARWLDPHASRLIETALEWRSGDTMVGLYYPAGKKRGVSVRFKPLLYAPSMGARTKPSRLEELKMGDAPDKYTMSKAKNKCVLSSIAAAQLADRGNVLIVARTIDHTWTTAKELENIMPAVDADERLSLVKKFVAAELGEGFPLVAHLDRGIGVHHAGLPDEIRQLVEWLMGEGLIKVMVSTTTMAQGVDFPVSSVLLSSYTHRSGPMQPHEFWNVAGRAGRVGQGGIGLVGIASDGPGTPDALNAAKFVQQQAREVASVMEDLIRRASAAPGGLDLHALASDPRWSSFVQYVAHMYNQSEGLQDFISRIEISLRNTYGYNRMDDGGQRALIKAVDGYGRRLDEHKEFSRLSDMTGFSPETVENAAHKIRSMGITESDWSGSGLFSGSSRLPDIMKGMMDGMPEIKQLSDIKASQQTLDHDALGRIIVDWVSGKSIPDISKAHFGGTDVGPIRDCVSAIYGRISLYATWGLSAMHKFYHDGAGSAAGSTMPAMVYYGVDSDEAVLMRMNSMPRSLSGAMGRAYAGEHDGIYEARSSDVLGWLNDLDDSKWHSAAPHARVSGAEYKQIWRRLAGMD